MTEKNYEDVASTVERLGRQVRVLQESLSTCYQSRSGSCWTEE